MQLTLTQLRTIASNSALGQDVCDAVNGTLVKYQITDKWEVCAFLANIVHESGGLRFFVESLNYSADRLLVVFPKYFKTPAEAQAYNRQPEKIANRVYASRMGNGDEKSGDGWKYRGRGAIQLTGKTNYTNFGAVNTPDSVATMPKAIESAGWFWNNRGIKSIAKKQDIAAVTRAVNGGLNGLDDRTKVLNLALKTL
ncbi:putative lysis protein [Delftia phage PhiW-14]|uniref:Putative lysis protein n=1 Tax=Delftia phage PhiW-14 TaxID=665032 RepID=C9DFY3_BPW14|nr:endolysin [Delftia phage PhiW-14]ACV50034.1 putative lysis protein [Delftia phage PhiW-14]